MSKSVQKTQQKVAARVNTHKRVRYHDDAYLFTGDQTKICPTCNRPFSNRKKWQSRGLWPTIIYCSKGCRKRRKSAD